MTVIMESCCFYLFNYLSPGIPSHLLQTDWLANIPSVKRGNSPAVCTYKQQEIKTRACCQVLMTDIFIAFTFYDS